MAWTYSDYLTMEPGASRLTQLRLHVKEVADRISQLSSYETRAGYQVQKDLASTQKYLDSLKKDLAAEEALVGAASGTRVGFSRGYAAPP